MSVIGFAKADFSVCRAGCRIQGPQAVVPLAAYSEHCVPLLVKRAPLPAVLGHFQNPSGPEQLQQVAGCAHQLPLAADILFAPQAEASKTALFLDLSEDRLNDRLAHLVYRASSLGS